MKALDEMQDKIIAQAIKGINTDQLVKRLTKKLEEEIENSFNSNLDDIDIGYWLKSELEDDSTKAGKAFSKAVSGITERMAKAINGST